MAKPYPILPLSVLDDMDTLNASLYAYQFAVEAMIRRISTEGAPYAHDTLIAGLDNLFQPILYGYKSVASQAQQFRDMGVVGMCQLAEDAESAAKQ